MVDGNLKMISGPEGPLEQPKMKSERETRILKKCKCEFLLGPAGIDVQNSKSRLKGAGYTTPENL